MKEHIQFAEINYQKEHFSISSWITKSTCWGLREDGEVLDTCMLNYCPYFDSLWSKKDNISIEIYPKWVFMSTRWGLTEDGEVAHFDNIRLNEDSLHWWYYTFKVSVFRTFFMATLLLFCQQTRPMRLGVDASSQSLRIAFPRNILQ